MIKVRLQISLCEVLSWSKFKLNVTLICCLNFHTAALAFIIGLFFTERFSPRESDVVLFLWVVPNYWSCLPFPDLGSSANVLFSGRSKLFDLLLSWYILAVVCRSLTYSWDRELYHLRELILRQEVMHLPHEHWPPFLFDALIRHVAGLEVSNRRWNWVHSKVDLGKIILHICEG